MQRWSERPSHQALCPVDTKPPEPEPTPRVSAASVRVTPLDHSVAGVIAYLNKNRFEDFEQAAIEALDAGEELTFTLKHHHTLNGLHPVNITVSSRRIAFEVIPSGLSQPQRAMSVDAPPTSCNLGKFSSPIQGLLSAEVKHNKYGELFLTIQTRNSGELDFADKSAVKHAHVDRTPTVGLAHIPQTDVVDRPFLDTRRGNHWG